MSESALVLSYVEGYSAQDVAPFVESLRSTGYTGDIVFFTYDVNPDCAGLFAEHDVRAIPVDRVDMQSVIHLPAWLAAPLGVSSSFHPDGALNTRLSRIFRVLRAGRSRWAQRVAERLWHCNSGRFFYYRSFLDRHRTYEKVLIADVRDVVFQRAPFDRPLAPALYLFEEYPSTPLGQQINNAAWIRDLYGPAVLDDLADRPIVCAGVIMGEHARVLEAVGQIARASVTNYVGWGTDQGTLNYLVRRGALSSAEVKPYGSGPAMHVGIAPRHTIRTDEDGRVRNREGEVCSIIHQYDRHPDLADQLLRPPGGRATTPAPEAPAPSAVS